MKRLRRILGRALPLLITALLIRFLIAQGGDLRELQQVIARVRWPWVALAVGLQAAAYGGVAWLNVLLLDGYQVRVPWLRQYLIQLTMAFVETVIPSAALSGLLLRIRLLKPYGAPSDVATTTTVIETALISGATVAPALLVAGVTLTGSTASHRALGLALGMVGLTASGAGVMVWRRRSRVAAAMRSLSERLATGWDRGPVARWPQRLQRWPSARLLERARFFMRTTAALLQRQPCAVAGSLLLRLGAELLAFVACFYALGNSIPAAAALLLYSMTIAVNTLGAIPGGVGLAEAALAALYAQFNFGLETAVAIALLYRLTGYWLPRAAGGLAWLWLERRRRVL